MLPQSIDVEVRKVVFYRKSTLWGKSKTLKNVTLIKKSWGFKHFHAEHPTVSYLHARFSAYKSKKIESFKF